MFSLTHDLLPKGMKNPEERPLQAKGEICGQITMEFGASLQQTAYARNAQRNV